MRKKILAFVFAAALLMALAVPLFGGGTALAANPNVPNPAGSPAPGTPPDGAGAAGNAVALCAAVETHTVGHTGTSAPDPFCP